MQREQQLQSPWDSNKLGMCMEQQEGACGQSTAEGENAWGEVRGEPGPVGLQW